MWNRIAWGMMAAAVVSCWVVGGEGGGGGGYCERRRWLGGDGRGKMESVLGDGGMKDGRVRVALESWNFCNRASSAGGGKEEEDEDMPSPRQADCANLLCTNSSSAVPLHSSSFSSAGTYSQSCQVEHLVTHDDNSLKFGQEFPQGFASSLPAPSDPDEYAIQKELYLGSLCEVDDGSSQNEPWQFWMIMLKNGNFDLDSGLCPSTAPPASNPTRHPFVSIKASSSFPCFGPGCMNHPRIFHNASAMRPLPSSSCNGTCYEDMGSSPSLSGSFYGTYDLDGDGEASKDPSTMVIGQDKSFFSVEWAKQGGDGGSSWVFHHVLRVNAKYPWLMLYLRADATRGFSGGYPWETRGMMVKVPESPNFVVTLTLNVLQGGGPSSQFYLLDMGGCWKNDGTQCDGNTTSDVTRYSEMIINPSTSNWCRPTDLSLCPPYHIHSKTGRPIYRNDTKNFPYEAYHLYCVPPNAKFAEPPFRVCDPYSNPQPQELMQLLPHPEWAVHGYPSTKGQGWVGDPRTWTLDVGGLSQRLFFYQDPNTPPAKRKWTSIDVGTEIFISQQAETAEWLVSDFDVLVQSDFTSH